MTDSTEFFFVVKKRDDNTPWIMLEPKKPGNDGVAEAAPIGLDLYKGTSLQEAKQLARFLNSNIKAVNYRTQMKERRAPSRLLERVTK